MTGASARTDAELCTCSPATFDLVLNLSHGCATDNVKDSPDIDIIFYFLSSVCVTLTLDTFATVLELMDFV